ncbi:septal ring lytic transglycosylase RlpA family protein [Alkalimonas amylolytica]|uniref:Endolytic peptidoglycan transglycosylase RlpA n=1 Tax=Alkalimonas amylolytica TaxID=152573 RepID=A0A1H4CQ15_ALKAM|nr:septal ring lytic transglycosylase RlpA family protein [Alkalimonas amylolytica]SEA62457.1 rare lipoprotein A [Alkalimonas amylolytica]
MYLRCLTLSLTILTITACSHKPSPAHDPDRVSPNAGRYQFEQDHKPERLPTLLEMIDPEPSIQPLSRGGNHAYRIFGVDYRPKTDLTEYKATGIASWYGMKFHGHKTANGEVYDMYSMSAAHKTLPLPSYVLVTNLVNQKSAIVRVNDRGPFHQDRIIDLSYAAAHKIGMLQQGTAPVQVELIASPAMVRQGTDAEVLIAAARPRLAESVIANTTAPQPAASCYIQVFASQNDQRATELGKQLEQQLAFTTKISHHNGVYRLLVGPIADRQQAQDWLQQLRAELYPSAYFTDSQACS